MKKDSFRPQQRFSLRKYSFGLASVILGASLFANDQTAQADENGGLVQPADPSVVTRAEGDPTSTVLETPSLASTAPAVQSEGHHISSELATSTLDVAVSVSETATLASSEAPSRFPASEASSESGVASALTASDQETRTNVATSEETVSTSPLRASTLTNATAAISLAQANDADDPMPGDDQLTDTTQFGRVTSPELVNFVPNLSATAMSGNSLTPVTFTGELAPFTVADDTKRVAAIWSVRDAAGVEDAYFVSFVYDLPSQTYEMRVYDQAKNLISTESVERRSGASKKLQLAGNPDAPVKEQAYVALSYENNGYDAVYNGTDGDQSNGRPADKSGVKRIYSAMQNSQIGTEYRALGSAIVYQSTGTMLPTAVQVTVNYLEEGSNRQLRPSDQFTGLVGDQFATRAASEGDFDTDFREKGYELDTSRSPILPSGTIEGTFWGGKGYVYVRDLTRNGKTMRYRSTVINDNGDIVMEGWDKETGKKLLIRGYKTVYMDAANGAYVLDRVDGSRLTEYEYVSQPIKAAAFPDSSTARWGAVAFHVTSGFDHVFTNSWKPSVSDITYWYSRPKGDVVVEYYLEGTDIKIAPDQKIADQVAVKEAYDATSSSLRPSEITHNGKRYRLVETNGSPVLRNGSAPVTGTVEKMTQAVQYEYRLVQGVGSVAVTYMATDGTILKARELVQDAQAEGTAYTTSALSFPNYKLLGTSSDSAPTSGTVTADRTLEVIYTYERQKGSVDVTYQTEDGTVLEGPTLIAQDADAGSAYGTSPKVFTGYSFKELASGSAAANGNVVGDDTLHVVYVYTSATPSSPNTGNVIVQYRDEEGNEIQPARKDLSDAVVGTAYNTNEAGENPTYIDKDGVRYLLKRHQGDETGYVVAGDTIVTYIYRALGEVVVEYVDEYGQRLINPRVVEPWQEPGMDYDTTTGTPRYIYRNGAKYEVERVEGHERGKVGKGRTTVTYVYRLVEEPEKYQQPETKSESTPKPKPKKSEVKKDRKAVEATSFKADSPGQERVKEAQASQKEDHTQSETEGVELPQTGEETSLLSQIGILLLAGLSYIAAFFVRKKKD